MKFIVSLFKVLKKSVVHTFLLLLLILSGVYLFFSYVKPTSSQIMRVASFQKISSTDGGLVGPVWGGFGSDIDTLGDLDGDGTEDIVVGNMFGPLSEGSIRVLILNADGTVKGEEEISEGVNGFAETLDLGDIFGFSVANMGDLDGDGVVDLLVGAPFDDDGGPDRGAVYILYMEMDGTVKASKKISDTVGGFVGGLPDEDQFGLSVENIGDLNGDGNTDIAVSAAKDSESVSGSGAVWILFLNATQDVVGSQKINNVHGNLGQTLLVDVGFGTSLANIGDVDGDGVTDIAVGSAGHFFTPVPLVGSEYILFMNTDGTVKSSQKISLDTGNFSGLLGVDSFFGLSTSALGDKDGDGVPDIAVGVAKDEDALAQGGFGDGAVWFLYLNSDGTVKFHEKIGEKEGSFGGVLAGDGFGFRTSLLGDIDHNGYDDFAIGASADGAFDEGALYIIFTQPDFAQPKFVQTDSFVQITDGLGGFTGDLDDFDNFGGALDTIGDLDGDGVVDLVVGVPLDDDGGTNRGAFYVLFMNSDGTVKSHQKVSDTEGGFTGVLDDFDQFGLPANIGDLDDDGVIDLVVTAFFDDDGGPDRGALYVLFMNTDGTVKSHQKISSTIGGFSATLDDSDLFGTRVAGLGDLDGDGVEDILTSATYDDDAFVDAGAVYILFMNTDGTVKSYQKITEGVGGFTGTIDAPGLGSFGFDLENIGDLDLDGVTDIAVGELFKSDGGFFVGAVWIMFLNTDGTVKSYQKISATDGGFHGDLEDSDVFGVAIENFGDLDSDGIQDIGVGALLDDDGAADNGAVWTLYLNRDGTVKRYEKLSATEGNFLGPLDGDDWFSIPELLGDINGDGVTDFAVGAYSDEGPVGGIDQGSVFVILRQPDIDKDGIDNNGDTDDDNDGIPDVVEGS